MVDKIVGGIENVVFKFRLVILLLFLAVTAFMAYNATSLKVEAGFNKLLPLNHEYMKTFREYQAEFGGANRILVALKWNGEGDIFENAEYLKALKNATESVFFLPGVDRSRVSSIFTANVRYVEVTEEGFTGGDVVPADFFDAQGEPKPALFDRVRSNAIKSGEVGRLVTNDLKGAMISADLQEVDPVTGEKLDYQSVARMLETELRDKYETDQISVHILGFAKSIGDIADGARSVVVFFGVALVITAILLYLYSGSIWLTVLPLVASMVAVAWQLGSLTVMGLALDPMSILVPFLVFAIGVSHGVQMINSWNGEVLFGTSNRNNMDSLINDPHGHDSISAARITFRRLLIPGGIALISDTIGFLTLLFIEIGIIQEMAITASLGVGLIIFTNLILMPILLSYVKISNFEAYRKKHQKAVGSKDWLWNSLGFFSTVKGSIIMLVIAGVMLFVGLDIQKGLKIGDLEAGVPELRPESRYNQDSDAVVNAFAIGLDVLTVISESKTDGCVEYDIMNEIDQFAWYIMNIEGVKSSNYLSLLSKKAMVGWNEGNPKWFVTSRNRDNTVNAIYEYQDNKEVKNNSCAAMPIMFYLADHKAETINRVIAAVKKYNATIATDVVKYRLATGNVGVMAATNEAVEAAQGPMLYYVYGAIIVLCLATFLSLRATICIVAPLALVSVLAYALMTLIDVGLKVSTLPVVALGVGIGVDYGIYIFARMNEFLKEGAGLEEAFKDALKLTGKPVIFTAITLGVGVATWIMSDLKFQADMGLLLTFMFVVNMLGAVMLLPALARILYWKR